MVDRGGKRAAPPDIRYQIFDNQSMAESSMSVTAWQKFLNEFGPESSKAKKKQRRAEVTNYVEPKDDRLGFVKRFGHMPSFEKPIGWDGKNFHETFKTKYLPFLTTEEFDWTGKTKKIENRFVWGDNLAVMRSLPDECLDLIYIDPPFFSGRNYNCIFGDDDEVRTFNDIWDGGLPTYLAWLNARLWEMKRLLKPTGSIFVHLDWHASHYVKTELDKIFGYDNFLNELVWCYGSGGASKSHFSRKHDNILWYSKTDKYVFNCDEVREPYKEKCKVEFKIINGKKYKRKNDLGRVPFDWFEMPIITNTAKERIGYPTQKPETLLEKLITAASKPGDVVADFFSGGGTTAAVAEKLGRRWLACDVSRIAISVARDRILSVHSSGIGIEPTVEKPNWGFSVQNHGAYDKTLVRQLEDKG
jgi:DNA modification methylase